MSIKLNLEEQIKLERQRNLVLLARNQELEEVIINQLVDLDFRQSLSEMEVTINDL